MVASKSFILRCSLIVLIAVLHQCEATSPIRCEASDNLQYSTCASACGPPPCDGKLEACTAQCITGCVCSQPDMCYEDGKCRHR